MHMISKKDLSNAEMDTLTNRSVLPYSKPPVKTHEEAIVNVKELDIFWTMKVLENTPAVLSLGMLGDENGFGSTTSHKERDSDNLQYGEFRSYRGSRLVKFVLWIFIHFKDTCETGESELVDDGSGQPDKIQANKTKF